MTRLIALAAGLMTSSLIAGSAVQAQDTYRFNIDGQTIRIERPRNCNSADCASVSIPGYYERDGRRSRREKKAERDRLAKEKAAAKSNTEAKGDLKGDAKSDPALTPPSDPKSNARLASPAPAETPVASPDPKVAAVSPTRALGPTASNASPLGTWLTEETNGKVRIEPCGDNLLCGYAIDPKSGDKADKVLIDMAASGPKWTGRIFDPGNGNNFDSSIAMSGSDRLRVQGCPTNATFCGSQVWTRVN